MLEENNTEDISFSFVFLDFFLSHPLNVRFSVLILWFSIFTFFSCFAYLSFFFFECK